MEITNINDFFTKEIITPLNEESIKGKTKDVKKYFLCELANQCATNNGNYEDLIANGRMILDLIEELEENEENDNKIIIVNFNPMGYLYYEEYNEESEN